MKCLIHDDRMPFASDIRSTCDRCRPRSYDGNALTGFRLDLRKAVISCVVIGDKTFKTPDCNSLINIFQSLSNRTVFLAL